MDSTLDSPDVPGEQMGLLSLTLAPSPVVLWILPAKIRSRRKHDIIFVGNTYIQLREFHHSSGQLSDVTAKLDLGTQIRGAKVISAKAQKVPMQDAILDQEWDEEHFLIKGEACPTEHPPQILMLVTASGELIYAYAKDSTDGRTVEIVFARRPILQDVFHSERDLRHTAIDSECKVMAVASDTRCTIFSLKEIDDLKRSIDEWEPRDPRSFQPNVEQRMIRIDGHIIRMDFLRPAEDEPDKVILLFLVENNKQILQLLYQWDTKEPLTHFRPFSGVVQTMHEEDAFPLLLIPSKKHLSFLIITETSVIFYDNVRTMSFKRTAFPLPVEPKGKKTPMWCQWAKPARHDGYSNQKEDILLLRDDGFLSVITRPHSNSGSLPINFSPGVINTGVDSAVCMLPGPLDAGGDTLIVGGSMSDGGVFHLPPRKEIFMHQIIPNISPIHDMAMLDSPRTKNDSGRASRTFATAGRMDMCTLNELRFGREAQIGWTIPVAESNTVNSIWTLEIAAKQRLLILNSHPERTYAVTLDLRTHEFEEMDSTDCPGLQLDGPTLAADVLASGIIVQITSVCVVAGIETTSPQVHQLENCVRAAIDHDRGTFAIVCQVEKDYEIRLGLVDRSYDEYSIVLSPMTYRCTEAPLCLAFFRLCESDYLAVGYLDGHIELLSIDAEGQLKLEGQLELTNSSIPAVTSLVVLAHTGNTHAALFAGSRDGNLKVVKVKHNTAQIGNRFDCKLDRVYHLGDTTVKVVEEGRPKDDRLLTALILCGSRLEQISSYKNSVDIDYMLSSIWLSSRNDLSYTPTNPSAVHRVRHMKSTNGGDPSHFFLCATKDEIVFATLIDQEQIVPRRLPLHEPGARKMLYYKDMNKLIVATDPSRGSSNTEKNKDDTKGLPILHSIHPDKKEVDVEKELRLSVGARYEKVTDLLLWQPTAANRHYDVVIICLNDSCHGHIGFINATKLESNPGSIKFKTFLKFENKHIYTVCAYDKASILISAGLDIIMLNHDLLNNKWTEECRFGLPSPALSLSVQGSVIYAATESHSAIVLKWKREKKVFEKVATDTIARSARMVHPLGKNGELVLSTISQDLGTTMIAQAIKQIPQPEKEPPKGVLEPILFEANLPMKIEQLFPIPSSWTESSQQAFQGMVADGTIMSFQTLTYNEWQLLRFVQMLAQPEGEKFGKRPLPYLSESMSRKYHQAAKKAKVHNTKAMHVQGDVLKRVVEKGPMYLHRLLKPVVKTEDEMDIDQENGPRAKLAALAKPILGEPEDVPAAVVVWMRKMLRATIF